MKDIWTWLAVLIFVWLFVQFGQAARKDAVQRRWGPAVVGGTFWLISGLMAALVLSDLFPVR